MSDMKDDSELRTEIATVEAFTVYGGTRLDPVLVVLQDLGGGKGRVIVECFGEAWTAYWGAMGTRSLRKFMLDCSVDYVANRMWAPNQRRTKANEKYLNRIITAVQESLRSKP